ncbi:SDR family oxidoreductase [Streptomyces sp. NPDC093085]|uniref:SDR family NAD(P)-dependent oxidoreductase n=1 Tax=Streptomyces sp. NPDC093085 TaxID=3155068 RepID=UPI00344823CC
MNSNQVQDQVQGRVQSQGQDQVQDLGRAQGQVQVQDQVQGRVQVQSQGQGQGQDLTGRVVIVTGASSGIGEATARLLHRAGALPVLAARRADRLTALGAELDTAFPVPTDMTDPAQVRSLVELTVRRYGRIDGLVNNAGASFHCRLEEVDPVAYARLLDLNVIGVLSAIQATAPVMRSQGEGRIVNVSSGTTVLAPPGVGAYAASKSAVNMLSAVARKELADDGIDVSLVLPSITATEFGGGMFRDGGNAPPGLVAHTPEYVARVILRALRTGEERIDIPHGPEQPEFPRSPWAPGAPGAPQVPEALEVPGT